MAGVAASRRERFRAQTRDEAKRLALGQLADAGPGALSLNAIAREMGVTGPALYRYFTGRDDLLTELAVDAYEDLADTICAAAYPAAPSVSAVSAPAGAGGASPVPPSPPGTAQSAVPGGRRGTRSPRARLHAVASAYRDWALSQPHRYLLLFGTPLPGYAGSGERTAPAARRTMTALLDVITDLVRVHDARSDAARPASARTAQRHGALERQLEAWAEQVTGRPVSAAVAQLGLTAWTRCHGLVSLEIEGHLEPLGADPAQLFAAEIDALLDGLDRRPADSENRPAAPDR